MVECVTRDPGGRGFEPHRHHCVVSVSKNINPSLVLVQPRKTRPFKPERLLFGRKEINQTNKNVALIGSKSSKVIPTSSLMLSKFDLEVLILIIRTRSCIVHITSLFSN